MEMVRVAKVYFVIQCLYLDLVMGIMQSSNKYNTLQLDYKVEIDPGKEDCYFHHVISNSTLYIDLKVIKGGDRTAGLGIKEPTGGFVLPYEWLRNMTYSMENVTGGYYGLCINNQEDHFRTKLVSIYLHNHILEDLLRFHEDFEQLEISVANITIPLSKVDNDMVLVLHHLHHARNREAEDYELLQDNHFYILFWSVLQCGVIICTGGFHVYFIRKLFDAPASRKPKNYF